MPLPTITTTYMPTQTKLSLSQSQQANSTTGHNAINTPDIAKFWKHNWQWFLVGIVAIAIPILLWAIFGPIKRQFQRKARNSVPIFWGNVGEEKFVNPVGSALHVRRSTSLGGRTLVDDLSGHMGQRKRSGSGGSRVGDLEALGTTPQPTLIDHHTRFTANLPLAGNDTISGQHRPLSKVPEIVTQTELPANTTSLQHIPPNLHHMQQQTQQRIYNTASSNQPPYRTRSCSVPMPPSHGLTYLGNPRVVRNNTSRPRHHSLQPNFTQQQQNHQIPRKNHQHHLSAPVGQLYPILPQQPPSVYDGCSSYRGIYNYTSPTSPVNINIPSVQQGPFPTPVRYCPPVVDVKDSPNLDDNRRNVTPKVPPKGWPLPE